MSDDSYVLAQPVHVQHSVLFSGTPHIAPSGTNITIFMTQARAQHESHEIMRRTRVYIQCDTYGYQHTQIEKIRQHATGTRYDAYEDLVFVKPRRERPIQGPLIRKVAKFISTRIPVSAAFIQSKLFDHPFVAWGKMQRITRNEAGDVTGGDLIRGHHIVANNCESRDASHVMVRGPAVVLDKETFGYGRAEQSLVIDAAFLRHVTECAGVSYPHLDDLVLAVVSPIPYLRHIASPGITQYGLRGGRYISPEILDASKIDCLVGRVRSPLGASYIVQRDTAVGQLDMLDEAVNPDQEQSHESSMLQFVSDVHGL
ncbi:hypothetical protein RHS04_05518 [Rhizoctonia solani]|uniref:Uncharacterized protein n=1 Tax=Rhizoctonia solani TaxID=456999 RepID=A0A8H7H6W8_9AGAM|nr:hypothetical protein RHS04_05518 [Rhizoctonia solani]